MARIEETWRWFGPNDPVTLSDIRQAGATGIVTALHHIPNGEVWPVEEILSHKKIIEEAGLTWSVVESIPVSEDIKLGTEMAELHLANYCQSIRNLGLCGVKTVTYNFMPVLDWTRTDLNYQMADGSNGLRFDMVDLAAFDIYILGRKNAEHSFSDSVIESAEQRFKSMDPEAKEQLTGNVVAGLPGSEVHLSIDEFKGYLARYDRVDHNFLRTRLRAFLEQVVPAAEESGVKLAIHPDDPPFDLFGLPRIVSTDNDLNWLLEAVPSPANGLCFCTGSLGARSDNDVIGMLEKYGAKVHFLHLRNVHKEEDGSFYEANHLEGDTDMYAVLKCVIGSQNEDTVIPMRPDHGHVLLDDAHKVTNPGYSAIGRLRGLAELRGVIHAVSKAAES